MDFEKCLPDNFNYEVLDSTCESSEIFSCELRANLSSESDFSKWLEQFQFKSNTTWIVRSTRRSNENSMFSFSRDYVCHHSSYRKNFKGQDVPTQKNKNCKASLTVRIKKDSRNTRYRDPYIKKGLLAVIKIDFRHSHLVNVAEAWKWLKRSTDTRDTFLGYFRDGMSPSTAIMHHENILMAEGVEQLMNSQRNPPQDWVYREYDKWQKENYGNLQDGDTFSRALAAKEQKFTEEGCTLIIEHQPLCISIVTPMMKRTLEQLSDSQSLFLDSTSSCDQTNSSLTVALVATKAGAVPVGIAIHSGQSEECYMKVFQNLNTIWNTVKPIQIENFMTDDSTALKNALEKVFPSVRQLLCQFHVLQALWRWLWTSKNAIFQGDRKTLMNLFRDILYSTSRDGFKMALDVLQSHPTSIKNQNFLLHVEVLITRKDEWCQAYRLDVRNRGNNTNNYAEATFRILKDIILTRLRAYNPIALMDFVFRGMEQYFAKRLAEVALGRIRKPHLLFQKCADKGQKVLQICDIQKTDTDYIVQSETDKSVYYHVDHDVCTCISGSQGAFCKHQAAVQLKYGIQFPNAPLLTESDKKTLLFIGVGHVILPPQFLVGMMGCDQNVHDGESAEKEICIPVKRNVEGFISEPTCSYKTDDVHSLKNDVMAMWDEQMGKMKGLISEHASDTSLLHKAEKFLKTCKKISTPMQLYRFFETSSKRSTGKRIKVQPTSVVRRKPGTSRGSSRHPAGRPRAGERHVAKKRLRALALNIRHNQPNAKTHGSGH